jgi:hypothetical protein
MYVCTSSSTFGHSPLSCFPPSCSSASILCSCDGCDLPRPNQSALTAFSKLKSSHSQGDRDDNHDSVSSTATTSFSLARAPQEASSDEETESESEPERNALTDDDHSSDAGSTTGVLLFRVD